VTPYYEHGGITIYHGDTLSTLSSLECPTVSALVTDPPYSSGNLPESLKQKSAPRLRGWQWADKVMETDQLSTLGFVWLIRELLVLCRGAMDNGASALVFIDWRNWGNLVGAVESAGFRVNNMIVWDKLTIGMGNGFRNQHELIVYASKGTPRVISRAIPNVIQARRPDNDLHQSPKPVGLMEQLLHVVTDVGDLVLDPFMGSGSTLMAAKTLGRRALGIEVEERYCEIAATRLSQEVLPLHEIALAEQEVLPLDV
jgi:site-specific DNA-methyltransferase (adenine-specific)